MTPAARKNKGKKFETKVADFIHDYFYQNCQEYKDLYDTVDNEQLKPRRDSSSGTFTSSEGDIELGVLRKFFPYSIECKDWKTLDISLNALIKGDIKSLLTVWNKQCYPVAQKKGLEPLLVFKANRTVTFCMTKNPIKVNNYVKVDGFYIYNFEEFIKGI